MGVPSSPLSAVRITVITAYPFVRGIGIISRDARINNTIGVEINRTTENDRSVKVLAKVREAGFIDALGKNIFIAGIWNSRLTEHLCMYFR